MSQGYSLDSYRALYEKGSVEEYSKYPNSTTIGFIIYLCTTECYERLMNMGFRRSGTFLYRSDLLRNCCRLYTIRTNLKFIQHATKGHRHTVNRFETFLKGKDQKQKKHSAGVSFNLKERILNLETTVDPDRFHTVIGPIHATEQKYLLFKKYQIRVHHEKEDDISFKGFKRFLCQTPFEGNVVDHNEAYWKRLNENWRNGSFEESDSDEIVGPVHECYYLDNQLVAIAVLDILPESISSVYLIWDPDYAHLGLGNLSALRELVLTQMLGKKYYYMGYYIDDCPKMRYKAKFGGEILDVCSGKYVRLDRARPFIEGGKLAVLKIKRDNEDTSLVLNEFEMQDGMDDETIIKDEPLINVAEQIYGIDGGSFTKAERTAQKLPESLISHSASSNEDYWRSDEKETVKLPAVSPGLMPLWQINEIYQDGSLKKSLENAYLYDQDNPGYYQFQADRDSKRMKLLVDLIRLIGLKQFEYPTLCIV
ncbi:hypothetical protein FOA43_004059 [Brettanomyces nanus]|uniref:arginyltransferase n=1 Tax=Eeniella nana TaxID=13502 RepID=A0A875S917_EENNA|nr:uncharacterized protein FOA43_004059 [Brettanomyces nanus]QPG76665.1 hypothetical protein FOA43_004059 [Brettanomyces nanus]